MTTEKSTERVAFLQRIDPEKVDGYRELHENVPDFVTDAMERAGVHDFRLFLRDEIAICFLEVEDHETYVEVMSADENIDEWERRANEFKDEGIDIESDEEQHIPWMDEIWRFTPER